MYTRGDPVNRYDPTGRDDCPPDDPCTTDPGDGSDLGPPDVSQGGGGPSGSNLFTGYSYEANPCQNMYGRFYASCMEQYAARVQLGMQVASQALQAVATIGFSSQCEGFIDNALGAGSLESAQLLANGTTVQNAVGVTTAAGATLFPNNPDYAAQEQNTANVVTGINGASLSALALSSPTTYAWGQFFGNAVFVNNAASWAGFGSGFATYSMLHEMLHVAGLGGDTQIEQAFGISPQLAAVQGSASITYTLMAQCGQ